MKLKDRISVWTISGVILIILSVVASAYPYWQESRENRDTGISNVGLWEVCFDKEGFAAPPHANDDFMKRNYGCTFVFDRDLRKIVHWIFPGWFVAVVTFVTLGLLIQPNAFILILLFMLHACSPHIEHILVGAACLLNLAYGSLSMIAILLFCIKASQDVLCMPHPESNFLSYSFGIGAFIPVICFFGTMSLAVDFIRLNTQTH